MISSTSTRPGDSFLMLNLARLANEKLVSGAIPDVLTNIIPDEVSLLEIKLESTGELIQQHTKPAWMDDEYYDKNDEYYAGPVSATISAIVMKKPGVVNSVLDLNFSPDALPGDATITDGTGTITISNLMFDSQVNAHDTLGFTELAGGYTGKMEFGFKTVNFAVEHCMGVLVDKTYSNECLMLGGAVLEGFFIAGAEDIEIAVKNAVNSEEFINQVEIMVVDFFSGFLVETSIC